MMYLIDAISRSALEVSMARDDEVARIVKLLGTVSATCVFLALAPPPAGAQHPFTPGVAFGADVFPYVDGNRDAWSVQFDLFTELSKDLDHSNWPQFERYNDIDRTIGFNQVGRTWVRAHLIHPATWWHQSYWVAGGVVWDAPTRFLQNNVAHGLRLLTYVPRDGTVDHAVLGVGGEQALSRAIVLNNWLDLVVVGSVGAGLSTSYMDGFAQVGGELSLGGSNLWLRAGGLGRAGKVSDPFLWEGLGDGLSPNKYTMWQAWLLLPFDSLTPWVPRLRVGFTHSKGPFKEGTTPGQTVPSPRKIERLWSIRLESMPGQWAVEMWNDFVFKDLGPTFGLRVQWYR